MTTNKTIEELAEQCVLKVSLDDYMTENEKESAKGFYLAGARAQKELSDAREAELMAVIEECKEALDVIMGKHEYNCIKEPWRLLADVTLTSINEKLEKLNGK